MLILIIVLMLMLGGGGAWYGANIYGPVGGIVPILVVVLLLWLLFGSGYAALL